MNMRLSSILGALGLLLAGCGGGGGSSSLATGNAVISGTVPGTLIEAIADDGARYQVRSTDNGTTHHPFSLSLPPDKNYELRMTTHDGTADAVTTVIGFPGADGKIKTKFRVKPGEHVDLGHVPLPMSPTQAGHTHDEGGERVKDDPMIVEQDGVDETGTLTPGPVASGGLKILGFNDLGMHCADLDYSVFSVLPPFNVVHAQVIQTGTRPQLLDDTQVSVDYLAAADATGSITTTSQSGVVQKINFWDTNPNTGNPYVKDLFGVVLPPDEGLAGQRMPGFAQPFVANDPMPFKRYDTSGNWFTALGIPLAPIDDNGNVNTYPLMEVRAKDKQNGQVLASTRVVLPISAESDCQNCHALGEVGADPNRHPNINFVFPQDITDPNSVLQAAKVNILRLHDANHGTQLDSHRPVLCASCHYSTALDLKGAGPNAQQQGHETLSMALHRFHGEQKDPATGQPVFPPNGTLDQTCYQCHPGKSTRCLRGAMGGAGIVCQNCHGDLLAVGGKYPLRAGGSLDGSNDGQPRRPWIDLPRCQSCHTGDANGHQGTSLRMKTAYDPADPSASPRRALSSRFAENPGKLYRDSHGHGGVACEGCHGSTHAIWPNANPFANDNVTAKGLQGHSGTLIECNVCHTPGSLGLTLDGPHGMHPVNDANWNHEHEQLAETDPNACRACHGQHGQGTPLARVAADRTLDTDEHGTIFLKKGTEVRCDLCHGNKL